MRRQWFGLALCAALMLQGATVRAELVYLTGPSGFSWEIDARGVGTPGDYTDSGTGDIMNGSVDATDTWPYLAVCGAAGLCIFIFLYDHAFPIASVDARVPVNSTSTGSWAATGRTFSMASKVTSRIPISETTIRFRFMICLRSIEPG